MGADSSIYEIVGKEAKEILSTAVSDVGYWQWYQLRWNMSDNEPNRDR